MYRDRLWEDFQERREWGTGPGSRAGRAKGKVDEVQKAGWAQQVPEEGTEASGNGAPLSGVRCCFLSSAPQTGWPRSLAAAALGTRWRRASKTSLRGRQLIR